MSVLSLALPPSGIRTAVIRTFAGGLVPIVRSSPGLGKSELMQSIADEFDLLLIDFRLGQADVTDLNGLPHFVVRKRADGSDDRRAEFVPFSDFPLAGDDLPIKYDADGKMLMEADGVTPKRYKGWLLFFDELTSAPKQIQAAAYKIMLEKKVGNNRLNKDVHMAGAGNMETDNAVVHAMGTALQSRLIHLEMRLDHKEWVEWAIKKGVDSRIIAYLSFRPNHLHEFNPQHQDRTFACPRTWWFAHCLIHARAKLDEIDRALLGGTVSAGISAEFLSFIEVYDQLPQLSDILNDPVNAPLPRETSVKYALTTTLAEHIDDKNVDRIVQYLERFPVEHRVICIRMARVRKLAIMRHKSINDMFVKLVSMM